MVSKLVPTKLAMMSVTKVATYLERSVAVSELQHPTQPFSLGEN